MTSSSDLGRNSSNHISNAGSTPTSRDINFTIRLAFSAHAEAFTVLVLGGGVVVHPLGREGCRGLRGGLRVCLSRIYDDVDVVVAEAGIAGAEAGLLVLYRGYWPVLALEYPGGRRLPVERVTRRGDRIRWRAGGYEWLDPFKRPRPQTIETVIVVRGDRAVGPRIPGSYRLRGTAPGPGARRVRARIYHDTRVVYVLEDLGPAGRGDVVRDLRNSFGDLSQLVRRRK